MNEDLLKLLREAEEQLMDMYRVADDSVSDYILVIQTAVNFINKALQTKDRLDIFKALQKTYDALEKEYDETPPDEEYDDLVDRIKSALDSGNSSLVREVKKILKEKYENPEDAFQKMVGSIQGNHPAYTDRELGRKFCHKYFDGVLKSSKQLLNSILKQDSQEYHFRREELDTFGTILINLISKWSHQIIQQNPKRKEEIIRISEILIAHFEEILNQIDSIDRQFLTKNDFDKINHINAYKEMKHLYNDIFPSLKKDIDLLFGKKSLKENIMKKQNDRILKKVITESVLGFMNKNEATQIPIGGNDKEKKHNIPIKNKEKKKQPIVHPLYSKQNQTLPSSQQQGLNEEIPEEDKKKIEGIVKEVIEKRKGVLGFSYNTDIENGKTNVGIRIDPTNKGDWCLAKEEILYELPIKYNLHSFVKSIREKLTENIN